MYCPHTVSLINYHEKIPYLTILRGVMLQGPEGRAALHRGEGNEDNIKLYIPFTVKAETLSLPAEGEEADPAFNAASFLPPTAYAACADPSLHWTLQPEGESAGRSGFFVKGELPEPVSLEEARDSFDFVYPVAGFTVHDYGSASMRHYEVVTKVSSRYYQYS